MHQKASFSYFPLEGQDHPVLLNPSAATPKDNHTQNLGPSPGPFCNRRLFALLLPGGVLLPPRPADDAPQQLGRRAGNVLYAVEYFTQVLVGVRHGARLCRHSPDGSQPPACMGQFKPLQSWQQMTRQSLTAVHHTGLPSHSKQRKGFAHSQGMTVQHMPCHVCEGGGVITAARRRQFLAAHAALRGPCGWQAAPSLTGPASAASSHCPRLILHARRLNPQSMPFKQHIT